MHRVVIQEADFTFAEVYQDMVDCSGHDAGAVVAFVGLVRDRNEYTDGTAVNSLTLEHYPGMTEKSIDAIVSQACERWPLIASQVIHRVGTMLPGEQIVMVAVASAHRDAAFDSARFIMDYLKTDAVMWKVEETEKDRHWVSSTGNDKERVQNWTESKPR